MNMNEFFVAVAELTVNHEIDNDKAVVYACRLGDLLEKIDPEWYEIDALKKRMLTPNKRKSLSALSNVSHSRKKAKK